MYVYLRTNFQVSSILLTSFRLWVILPPPPPPTAKQTLKEPTLIRVNWSCKDGRVRKLKENKMFDEIRYTGQKYVSVRWVFTEKIIDVKKIVKARLVARGFEETNLQQTDSPACSKESLWFATMLFFWKGWKCNTISVKAVILQGKPIERDTFSETLEEFKVPNVIWKLKTCLWGKWSFANLAHACKREPGIFGSNALLVVTSQNCFIGITEIVYIVWWQSMLIICGVEKAVGLREISFRKSFETFKISKEIEIWLKCLGLNLIQYADCITMDRISYINALEPIHISKEGQSQKNLLLGEEELKKNVSWAYELGCYSNLTRPPLWVLWTCHINENCKR